MPALMTAALGAKGASKVKKIPGGPIVQAIVVIAILTILYFVLKGVVKGISRTVTNLANPSPNPQDIVDETPTADGTEATEEEEDAFAVTASQIAGAQYNAMEGTGTDEAALFTSLVNLNGTQLQQVFAAYGKKGGRNLFEWYADELTDNPVLSPVYFCGGFAGLDCEDGQVPGCESYWDSCQEREFMRSIWQKSGIPITF